MSLLMETEGLSVRPSLDGCIKCTICESACPYAAVTERFPGPKTVGPQEERFRHGPLSADWSVDYCSGCGICSRVCPQDVRIAEINSRARAQLKEQRGIPLRDQLLARPDWMGRLGRPIRPLFNWAMGTSLVRFPVERILGIHRKAAVPKVAPRTFQQWARRHPSRPARDRVVYFHGCSTNYFEPRLGRMVVAVLEHQGLAVEIPSQGCCGLPLQSNGNFPAARTYATRLARQLHRSPGEVPVIASSTSCGLMLKREAREILGVEDPALIDISERTYDIFEFLRDLHEQGRLKTDFVPVEVTAAYHAPCQQQNQLIGKPALDVLALIPGLKLVELDRDCCGVGGTYGIKREKYAISMAVGAGLFSDIKQTAPDLVLCDSETCRWHIAKATGFPVIHPLELLHRAYGGH
ncbi:MAG: anaerobic glycerol-3-phosphate dehydrogenase subunit C [Candidatus Dormiibacterota bacterium]